MRALVALGLVLLAGCGGAKPYERAKLSKPKMAFDADPDTARFESHVYEYREGSAGGLGAEGGGCGCN